MQLRLPFSALLERPQRPGATSIGSGLGRFEVHFVRVPRAKRYVMRLRPDGALRVTIPRGGSKAEAVQFAERHLDWAERQRSRQRARPSGQAWTDGTPIMLDGVLQPLRVTRLAGRVTVSAGSISIPLPQELPDYRPAVVAALKVQAGAVLPPQLLALAARFGLSVRRVTVRDQRSRWGSCSTTGTIALNYRLVQTPPEVRDYILVHELAHLTHPNHSRRFWKLVGQLCPRFRDAERWLKVEGRNLF